MLTTLKNLATRGLLLCTLILTSTAWSQEEAKPELPAVGYDKGFFIQSPDGQFKLVTTGYVQGRFSGVLKDDAPDSDSILIRRARLKWAGHMFNKNTQYMMEYDFSSSKLLTTYLQLVRSEQLRFRLGQSKVPFNLEGISSGSTLQFVDRSIIHAAIGIQDERDIGLGFNGDLMEKQLEYEVSAFNGEGANKVNQNNELRYVGRLVYNLKGHHGTEFSDVKNSQEPNIALALAGMHNDTPDATTGVESKIMSLTGELSAKYKGLGFHGEYLFQNSDPDDTGSTHQNGFVAQVGYFVLPKTLEFAGRVAQLFQEGGSDLAEYRFAVNYYLFEGHKVKFQFDYAALTKEDGIAAGDDSLDHAIQAQLQIKI